LHHSIRSRLSSHGVAHAGNFKVLEAVLKVGLGSSAQIIQRVDLGPQDRFLLERLHPIAKHLRAQRERADEKLRVRVETCGRPPLVDGVIGRVVPTERKRLLSEDVAVVEHRKVCSCRVDRVERPDTRSGQVHVVVVNEAITRPFIDLHEPDVRAARDSGGVAGRLESALVDQ